MSEEDITFAILVGSPLVAAVSLGLLARALVDGGSPSWTAAGLGCYGWSLW